MTTFPLAPTRLRTSLAARRTDRLGRQRLARELAEYRTPAEQLELQIILSRAAA